VGGNHSLSIDAHAHEGEDEGGPRGSFEADQYLAILRANGVDAGFALAPASGFLVEARAGNEVLMRAREQRAVSLSPPGFVPRFRSSSHSLEFPLVSLNVLGSS